ncbi:MAG: hypothetical protein LAN84_11760 [Acidobacteriia bacterium]|nr:hypothetical protein [Terriglobia bacterium]
MAHRRYREMCVLASTGQLGGAQMCELNDHIAGCLACRKFLESAAQASVQLMPLLAESRAPAADIAPPEGMRARFLARLAAEELSGESGGGLRPQPFVMQKPLGMAAEKPAEGEPRGVSAIWTESLPLGWRRAAALAAGVVLAVTGFYAGKHRATPALPLAALVDASRAPLAPGNGNAPAVDRFAVTHIDGADRVQQLEQQKAALEARLGELRIKLTAAAAQQRELSKKLADTLRQVATLASQGGENQQRLVREDQQAKNLVASLQDEVGKLRWQVEESKARLAMQQRESDGLKAMFAETQANLQRELNQKSAKSEIGELVAARNLHIIDVYDADNQGKRQRSFGRVFYIEGRSLVFYAYDLDDSRRLNARVVFHVWGEKAGMKATTHSLGILRNDDASRDRWAMTFDDPKVLQQINSVFVTAEAANKRYLQPHGKKVLYAYFGSQPNHP